MDFNLISVTEKPIRHIGLADWHAHVNRLRDGADARCNNSFKVRCCSDFIRNETKIDGDWKTYESNEALASRIEEVNRWHNAIKKTRDRIGGEVRIIKKECASTERDLEFFRKKLYVIADSLTMRDTRLGPELTEDEPDTELKNELQLLNTYHKLLSRQWQEAFDKVSRLEEVEQKLNTALEDQVDAVRIDSEQFDLNKFSANLTFKCNPCRHPENSYTYEAWLESVKNLKQMAENEIADTYAAREALEVARAKTKNIVLSQQERTEHSLRKRIFETLRAKHELEWQKLKMNEEMEKIRDQIKLLEKAYQDKATDLKLAETRLENRTARLNIEKCLDEAYDRLCREVNAIQLMRRNILDQINAAKCSLHLLEEHERKIVEDIKFKEHSLSTDNKALDIRARLREQSWEKDM